jgi:hypothetical protein
MEHFAIWMAFLSAFPACRLPFAGRFLRVLNTMIHESGHAFMALITSGEVKSVELASDASGTAKTGSSFFLSRILVVLSGYLFSSFFAFLSTYLLLTRGYTPVFYVLLSFALVNLMLWVRNAFGMIWIVLFLVITGSVWLYLPNWVLYLCWFYVGILWFESLYTCFILLRESFKNGHKAGDASAMKELLFLPSWFWAMGFTAFAVWMCYCSLRLMPCLNNF